MMPGNSSSLCWSIRKKLSRISCLTVLEVHPLSRRSLRLLGGTLTAISRMSPLGGPVPGVPHFVIFSVGALSYCRRAERLRTSMRLSLQLIPLDLAVQRRAFDVQNGSRLALVPVGVLKRLQNVFLLDFFQRDRLVNGSFPGERHGPAGFERGEPDIGGIEHGAVFQ